jgi:hypothetical protein
MTMETAAALSVRLSKASVKKLWNPYTDLEWPETVDRTHWFMSPELCSIYGTELWSTLTEQQQKDVSFWELVNFFSITLQGERPLVQGLAHQMYSRQGKEETHYMHHFLDEENKHMVMFSMYCHKYAGKVYPEKKIALAKQWAPGEEDVAFFIKALVVEELGDVYNVQMMKDQRIDALAREVNRRHHDDEARHIIFGRRRLKEMFHGVKDKWSPEILDGLRKWVGAYLRSSWGDFYNPTMYKDAGLPDAYKVRTMAMAHPVCAESRKRISTDLVNYFLETGILTEAPQL